MKAVYFQNGEVHVGNVAEPVPGKGQALVRTHSCGLCASDQHYLHSGKTLIEMSKRFGGSYAALDYTGRRCRATSTSARLSTTARGAIGRSSRADA